MPFSAKIILHLAQPKPGQSDGPSTVKKADFVKLSFRKGGKDEVRLEELLEIIILVQFQFHSQLKKALDDRVWDKVKPPPVTKVSCHGN